MKKYLCQQLSIIEAHCGSTSFGISSRWFMNPTAPITCKYPDQIVGQICDTKAHVHILVQAKKIQILVALSCHYIPILIYWIKASRKAVKLIYIMTRKLQGEVPQKKRKYLVEENEMFQLQSKNNEGSFLKNWNTCIALRLSQGIFSVASSHKITPKLYTSDLNVHKHPQKQGLGEKYIKGIQKTRLSLMHTSHQRVHCEGLLVPSIEAMKGKTIKLLVHLALT